MLVASYNEAVTQGCGVGYKKNKGLSNYKLFYLILTIDTNIWIYVILHESLYFVKSNEIHFWIKTLGIGKSLQRFECATKLKKSMNFVVIVQRLVYNNISFNFLFVCINFTFLEIKTKEYSVSTTQSSIIITILLRSLLFFIILYNAGLSTRGSYKNKWNIWVMLSKNIVIVRRKWINWILYPPFERSEKMNKIA